MAPLLVWSSGAIIICNKWLPCTARAALWKTRLVILLCHGPRGDFGTAYGLSAGCEISARYTLLSYSLPLLQLFAHLVLSFPRVCSTKRRRVQIDRLNIIVIIIIIIGFGDVESSAIGRVLAVFFFYSF